MYIYLGFVSVFSCVKNLIKEFSCEYLIKKCLQMQTMHLASPTDHWHRFTHGVRADRAGSLHRRADVRARAERAVGRATGSRARGAPSGT